MVTYIGEVQDVTGLPKWLSGKESACCDRRHGFNPGVGTVPWRRKWQPTPVFLPGKFSGQRNLSGCSLLVAESDMTEHARVHASLWDFLFISGSVTGTLVLIFSLPPEILRTLINI